MDNLIPTEDASPALSPREQESLAPKLEPLSLKNQFCPADTQPFDTVRWEKRDARIGDLNGELVFEQLGVEVPRSWSQTATNVVVSKYFQGHIGTPDREHSVRQLIGRVCDTIARWGMEDGYFEDQHSAEAFRTDLTWLCLHQHLSFNSPVWFNVGAVKNPQASACFINSVADTMESILGLATTEGLLFKWGSGAGSNLSPLRSSKEQLSGGGTASGPVSFMRGYDSFAGSIKSGGRTRRAAKMIILNADHPDIREFVNCKAVEEKKAWALIDAGYDGGFNVPGGAYDSVFFQNANHSVRVSDEFMQAVELGEDWSTRAVTNGQLLETFPAHDLMKDIADAAWLCGDPGIQFDTTINDWHTCPNTDRIHASNPCSEYMFLNNSACNLASLNLMRFRSADGSFQVERFKHAVRLSITAQEILVDRCSYPTPLITKNSHDYRPLGLGYANLGALLMIQGLPYDSEEGRAFAGAVTALMHGEANLQSARLAKAKGSFTGYTLNREPFLRVMKKHRDAAWSLKAPKADALLEEARKTWDEVLRLGESHGFRNAQVTVLAPTGTISFMMDCDTTGVEPDIALIKYKKLVGGGTIKIVNQTVPHALRKLGYSDKEVQAILDWLETEETIEGAPGLKESHLSVFDCAFQARKGSRSITPMGHVRMMAATQPFLSGAISKTVNMPSSSTPEEIADIYHQAWKLGLKAIAIYRDGCKRTQPLSTSKESSKKEEKASTDVWADRRRLPAERQALTHKFSVGGHEGYITVGLYEDGLPGELFLKMSKEGSTVSGLMDTFATAVSMALQYGVPLQALSEKFCHTRFEPSGFTGSQEIPYAKSLTDYIFRWLELRFGEEARTRRGDAEASISPVTLPSPALPESKTLSAERDVFITQADAPPCSVCGSLTVRSGSCYKCMNCGATTGCS